MDKTYTKKQAATELIETSIELFFNDASIAAITLLNDSAYEIMSDIANVKKINLTQDIYKYGEEVVLHADKNQTKRSYWSKTFEERNFLKHAKKDSNENIKISYKTLKIKLMQNFQIYYELWGAPDFGIMYYYKLFFYWDNPANLNAEKHTELKDIFKITEIIDKEKIQNKKAFLEFCKIYFKS